MTEKEQLILSVLTEEGFVVEPNPNNPELYLLMEPQSLLPYISEFPELVELAYNLVTKG